MTSVNAMPNQSDISQALRFTADSLGYSGASLEPIGTGRNSRVYLADCGDLGRYAIKFYPDDGPGARDRLSAEFSGLAFLWENGLRCIPEPMATDPSARCAAYRFVEGAAINPTQVTESDIGSAVEFLGQLKALTGSNRSAELANAADACFSELELFDNIQRRIDRLRAVEELGSQHQNLKHFIETGLSPALGRFRDLYQNDGGAFGQLSNSALALEKRTLSPSDFGFHNAIRRPGGELVFLDFEYFGWDDPAKTVCDFILHPAMNLDDRLKEAFLTQLLLNFADQPELADRAYRLYPLYSLKWCTILLNAFLPTYLSQRGLSKATDLQAEQLTKARTMLEKANGEYQGLFNRVDSLLKATQNTTQKATK
jgi:hypothetical protein